MQIDDYLLAYFESENPIVDIQENIMLSIGQKSLKGVIHRIIHDMKFLRTSEN